MNDNAYDSILSKRLSMLFPTHNATPCHAMLYYANAKPTEPIIIQQLEASPGYQNVVES